MEFTNEHPLFETFVGLAVRRSPENLTCDGECSSAEVRRRLAQIWREWEIAERKLGRKITETEVWEVEMGRKP